MPYAFTSTFSKCTFLKFYFETTSNENVLDKLEGGQNILLEVKKRNFLLVFKKTNEAKYFSVSSIPGPILFQ